MIVPSSVNKDPACKQDETDKKVMMQRDSPSQYVTEVQEFYLFLTH